MKDGDAIAADGERISPDPELDRREFLEEPEISVLFPAEIAQDVIITEIDLLCDAGLRLLLQMASILDDYVKSTSAALRFLLCR